MMSEITIGWRPLARSFSADLEPILILVLSASIVHTHAHTHAHTHKPYEDARQVQPNSPAQ